MASRSERTSGFMPSAFRLARPGLGGRCWHSAYRHHLSFSPVGTSSGARGLSLIPLPLRDRIAQRGAGPFEPGSKAPNGTSWLPVTKQHAVPASWNSHSWREGLRSKSATATQPARRCFLVFRLAWASDLHLDWLDEPDRLRCIRALEQQQAEAVLITGDIADGAPAADWLRHLARRVGCPIYFVLGNHDFYGSSLQAVRHRVTELAAGTENLHYLTAGKIVRLTPTTGLVGHDGWADARVGNHLSTPVRLVDFFTIQDFAGLVQNAAALRDRLRLLGYQAARYVERWLPVALDRFRRVILATHVPPFVEACWYRGGRSNDDWLPYVCCHAMGRVLRSIMRRRPDRHLTVLCGHTHGCGTTAILHNLQVITGRVDGRTGQVHQMLGIA